MSKLSDEQISDYRLMSFAVPDVRLLLGHIDALQAEVERLKVSRDYYKGAVMDGRSLNEVLGTLSEVRTENARLREALNRIGYGPYPAGMAEGWYSAFARNTLSLPQLPTKASDEETE